MGATYFVQAYVGNFQGALFGASFLSFLNLCKRLQPPSSPRMLEGRGGPVRTLCCPLELGREGGPRVWQVPLLAGLEISK